MRIFTKGHSKKILLIALTFFIYSCSSNDQEQMDDDELETEQGEELEGETADIDEIDPAEELAEETDQGALDAMSSLSELTEAIQETEEAPVPDYSTQAPAELPAPAPQTGVTYVGYNVGNVLFVKNADGTIFSEPNASAAAAGSLASEEKVIVQGRKSTWIKIGDQKWVAFADLSADIRLAKSGTHFVTAYKLNIRNKPNGKILGQLAKGEKISIKGNSGNWLKIGPGRFVHKRFVSNQIAH